MRNILTGKESVYAQLKERGYDVVLLAPPYAADMLRKTFNATVEEVTFTRSLTRGEALSYFITKHLNLTGMMVLGSKYGLRLNLNAKTRHQSLHAIRWFIAHTLGRSRWFRKTIAPKLHLMAFRRRPLHDLFLKLKPDLIFTPNMTSSQGEEVLREAVRLGIPTMGMVGSWDHPHKRFQALQTDEVFVWSPALKDEMETLQSYDEHKIIVSGAPHFDLFHGTSYHMTREAFCEKHSLDPALPIFTLFSGTGRAPDEGDIVDMLLNANEQNVFPTKIQLFVRAYPGDPDERKKFSRFEGTPHVHIDWLTSDKAFGPMPLNYFPDEEYMREFVSLYQHSKAVMSVYSSASVEASIYRQPSINIAFDGYQSRPYEESVKRFVLQSHFDKLFQSGAVLDTHSKQDLLTAVTTVLTDPHTHKEGIERLRDHVCGVLDGQSAKRMVDHIDARMNSRP
jgi:hypothetical protein